MADQSGLAEYPVQLECGHRTTHVIDGGLAMICAQCVRPVIEITSNGIVHGAYPTRRIMAFETREWHMKCQQCRVGKWTGKDELAARRAKTQHSRTKGHFQIVIDFLRTDRSRRMWRDHYGRKRTPAWRIEGYV